MTQLDGTVGVLTGASGFLGRAFLRALGPNVTVFAAFHSSDRFAEWASTLPADVRPVQVDLTRTGIAAAVPTELDWALCLAARVDTTKSREHPIDELVHVAGPAVNSVSGLSAGRIVHVSSGSVYETLEGRLSPGRTVDPRLPYSVGKLAGELLVASYAQSDPWIVRFFGAYGPGEPAYKITPRLIRAFVRGESQFALTGDGTNRIDPMHIDDAAAALMGLIEADAPARVVDLCQGESLTLAEYAKLVYEVVHDGAPPSTLQLQFEGLAHEQMRGSADPTEADVVHGRSKRTLRKGLTEYVSWLRAR